MPGSDFKVRKKKARLSSNQKEQLKDGYFISHKTKLTSTQKEMVKQMVQSIYSEIPIFVAVMSKCNVVVEFYLTFPRHYAKKYLTEEPHMCLQRQGRKWEARYCEYNGGKKLTIGWKQFVKDNKLKMGDICLFKLLSNERTMKVYIISENVANYRAGLQNDADREAVFRRGAHDVDGARDPDSRFLRTTKTEAMEDDVVFKTEDGA